MDTSRTLPRLDFRDANRIRDGLLSKRRSSAFDQSLFEECLLNPKAFPATGAVRIQESELLNFRESCIVAVDKVKESNADFNSAFDIVVGREIENLGKVAGSELGISAVWDFLTLVLLPDLAIQRFTLSKDDESDKRSVRSRLSGGDRRHVLQRLWKRRVVFGAQIVDFQMLTEDDYGSLLERRLTHERHKLARKVSMKIINSGFQGSARRDYTRSLMRALVQMSGVVQFSDDDLDHLDDAIEHADSLVRQLPGQAVAIDVALPSANVRATPKARIR